MSRIWTRIPLALLFLPLATQAGQDRKSFPNPDERFKADLLLVVAHPDDEAAATPYLARALDEHKRVAVVYGTRGSSGSNSAGAEQASALGVVREIEARNALSTIGITNVWFLGGKDTASQNALQSLANWGHGASLEQLVRIVRLTRPEVILTFLPGVFVGEDHGDHQAAGVIATEAFDCAGDSAVFPEQVAAATKRLEPFLENLRPWQPKKIYYFPDADREDIFRGKGPAYSVKEISPSSKKAYWRMAVDSFRAHQTQEKSYLDLLASLDEAELEKKAATDGWTNPQSYVLGKSLVGGGETADIFESIGANSIPFLRPEFGPLGKKQELYLELGGPWSFYADFRREHGLMNLPHAEPPEIAVQAPGSLSIPLWVGNQSEKSIEVNLTPALPPGWTALSGTGRIVIGARQVAGLRIEANLPALPAEPKNKTEAVEIAIRAEASGRVIGEIKLRVEPRKSALPQ
jgi:LmbE family N-acetylglucosaminyl deacetylase